MLVFCAEFWDRLISTYQGKPRLLVALPETLWPLRMSWVCRILQKEVEGLGVPSHVARGRFRLVGLVGFSGLDCGVKLGFWLREAHDIVLL